LHFVGGGIFGENKPWHISHPFYNEWKNNLEKADLIDLKNIPNVKKWSLFKIRKENKHLSRLYNLSPLYLILVRFIYPMIRTINNLLGRIGLFLELISPKLYKLLKKIKNG
jgi:hypothetical protein